MIDEYRLGWALRYLREARAELEAARKTPCMAPNLVLKAVRKARNAVHYSLGEPAFIEKIVEETDGRKGEIEDPVLRCLVRVEEKVQRMKKLEKMKGKAAMKKADNLVQLASEIVETLTGEEVKD